MDLCYIVYSKSTAFKTINVIEGSCRYNMINNNDSFPMLNFHALTIFNVTISFTCTWPSCLYVLYGNTESAS